MHTKFYYFLAITFFIYNINKIAAQTGTLPIQKGMAVLTHYSGDRTQGASDPNGFVISILDIRGPNCNGNTAPYGPNNWLAPSNGAYHHSSWTASNLGEIFGIDLQNGSANPDFFVTSSGLTAKNLASTLVVSGGTGGDVFRVNGSTGAITKLASLPNTIYDPSPSNTGVYSKYVGLGNVTYNSTNNVLYVSNLDNGLIYVLNATNGAILGTYDHLPGTPDDPNNIFTTNLRQVYGVSYNKLQNRLYYAVPTTVGVCNVSRPSGNGLTRYVTENTIYSLAINADGTLNSVGKVLIAKIPTQTQIQCVNDPTDPSFNMSRVNYGVISDIEFNHDFSSMLIAERTLAQRFQPNNNPMKPTDLEWYAHESRVFRYDLSGSTWSQAVKYSVGNYNGRLTNSSGGVDFGFNDYGTCGDDNACEDAMVGLSDALRFENVGTQPYTNIYGILISDINGNSTGYPGNSYFIDIDGFTDGLTAIDAKSTLGDIEVFDNNCLALPTCTLSASCTSTPQTNCGSPNGTASVSITGGQGTITYLWSSGETTASISNKPAGTYTVTVTDDFAAGCNTTCQAIISNNTTPPAVSCSKVDNSNCATPNGTATATASGVTYLWSNGGTTATITGLNAGTYTVTVTNTTNSCTNTCSVSVINNTLNPTANCSVVANSNCATPNGTATATASGVTYLWSNGGTTATITGLNAGTYTVTVTSTTSSCTNTCSAVVTNSSAPPSVSCSKVDNSNCATPNGTATATASGVTYLWSNGATTATITGLNAGTYTVTVTSTTSSCTNTCSAVVTNSSAPPSVSCLKVDNSNCATPNGTATATASGVTYLWSNGGTTATITGLNAGTYTVTVTSTTNSCTNTCSAIVANSSAPPSVTCSKLDNTNCATPNGTATATASGVTYLWSNGGTTATITGLNAGTYTVTVTSTTNSCTATCSAVVATSTTPPTVTCSKVDNTNCATPNGSATATATGVTYLWSNGGTTATITGLNAGTYTVTVTSTTNSCTATCSAVVATTSTPPTVTCTPTQPTCIAPNGGSVTAAASGGGGSYSYLWSNGASGATISGLSAGTYTVTITDANNCTATCSSTLNAPTGCCEITLVSASPGTCNSTTNKYNLNGSVTFSENTSANLVVKLSTGDSVIISSPSSPQTYAFIGLTPTGNAVTVTAYFIGNTSCNNSTVYTSPLPCPYQVPPCAVVANVVVNGCNSNGTLGNAADDYFSITVSATATNPGGANKYIVAYGTINSLTGAGGNVLNPGGSTYGTAVVLGNTGQLKADGTSTFDLSIRDSQKRNCFQKVTIGPINPCSPQAPPPGCKPALCVPVQVTKN